MSLDNTAALTNCGRAPTTVIIFMFASLHEWHRNGEKVRAAAGKDNANLRQHEASDCSCGRKTVDLYSPAKCKAKLPSPPSLGSFAERGEVMADSNGATRP